ncbi:MAG TPA: DNA-directed RNA polymerase subunit alpha [Candidatus Babeliaceae bacterium]|nr:DNA-directed RNA polymerase subunit alpha [Candidatus Babeliaceae bacterium]
MNRKEYQPLTIPRLNWNRETLSDTYGELIAQPLEPGFGITLGNTIRRILLGGIEGSAVTSIIIKGVNNEFLPLPGVVEDTMQVILNIKEIVVRNRTGKPGKMTLHIEGESIARAGDIVADEHLEVINTEHIIAHVSSQGILDIEFFVESGRGYHPAQWPIGQAIQADDRIYVDAMFSSIKKVTYDVEKTRVGRDIDYDKLILAITTDGTETPLDVLHYAVSVLRNQLEHFLSAKEIPFNELSAPALEQIKEKPAEEAPLSLKGVPVELLLKSVEVLELSVRAQNCLLYADIMRIIDLVNLTEDEVLKIKNFGRKSYEEVKERMKALGLYFGMGISESDLKILQEREIEHESSKR